jgi:hypothetical protein
VAWLVWAVWAVWNSLKVAANIVCLLLALRDEDRLGKLWGGSLKISDNFPLETLYFALEMV